MCDNFKYKAFISYNSKDVKWGKRLQRRLEWYITPIKMWKKHLTLRPLSPVFFAPTDIEIGELKKEIKDKLSDSANLIVICSPNAAQSEWVGKEIKFFIELGRLENIHFFIVNGEPNSVDRNKECFHPIIKELGLNENLGANIHERNYFIPRRNRERAYTQIISKLLGVSFNDIWKRHTKVIINLAISVLLLITLLLFIVSSINKSKLITQAKYIANEADKLANNGDVYNAMRLMNYVGKNNKLAYKTNEFEHVVRNINLLSNHNLKHTYHIRSIPKGVTFSPNGTHFLTCTSNSISLFSIDGINKTIYEQKRGDYYTFDNYRFSPEGKYVIAREGEDQAGLWTVDSMIDIKHGLDHYYKSVSPIFSSNDEYLLLYSKDTVYQYSVEKNKSIPLYKHDNIYDMKYFCGDKYIMTTSRQMVMVWDIENNKLISQLPNNMDLHYFELSPSNNYMIYKTSRDTLHTYSIRKASEVCRFNINDIGNCFIPTQDDYFITIENDDIIIKKYNDFKFNKIEHHHNNTFIMFSDNEEILLTRIDKNKYNCYSLKKNCKKLFTIEHNDEITSAVISKDERYILTASRDNTAKLWSIDNHRCINVFHHMDDVYDAIFSPNEEYILTAGDDVKLWKIEHNNNNNNIEDILHKYEVIDQRHLYFSHNNDYMIIKARYRMYYDLWSLKTKTLLCSFDSYGLFPPIFYNNDKNILCMNSPALQTYNIEESIFDTIEYSKKGFSYVGASADGRYIITNSEDDRIVKLWYNNECVDTLSLNTRLTSFSSFSPDGNFFLSIHYDYPHTALLWSLEERKCIDTIINTKNYIRNVAFSPINKLFVISHGYNNAEVWRFAENGTINHINTLHHDDDKKYITDVSYSRDGEYLLSQSDDGSIKIWSKDGSKELRKFRHGSYIKSAHFSDDCKYVVALSADGVIKVWSIEEGNYIQTYNCSSERFIRTDIILPPNSNYILCTDPITYYELLPIDTILKRFTTIFYMTDLTKEEKQQYHLN